MQEENISIDLTALAQAAQAAQAVLSGSEPKVTKASEAVSKEQK